jgi:hypothetical protein
MQANLEGNNYIDFLKIPRICLSLLQLASIREENWQKESDDLN